MAFVFSFLCTCTESFDRGLAPSSSSPSGAFDRCCCRRFQCQDTSACSTLRSPRFLLCYQIRRQTITKFMAAAQDGVSPCALRLWVSQCTSTSLGFSKNFTNVCRSDSTGSSPAKLLEVWSGPKLTYTRFTFDYVYNLVQFLRSTPFAHSVFKRLHPCHQGDHSDHGGNHFRLHPSGGMHDHNETLFF